MGIFFFFRVVHVFLDLFVFEEELVKFGEDLGVDGYLDGLEV
jgi:hypothetical protein